SGFGQSGPMRDKPAMDPVLQAFTGFMIDNKGHDGIPHRTPTIINDMSTSLYAFQAVSAALYARRDDPRGRHFDINLMQGAANLQAIRLGIAYVEGMELKPRTAPSGIFHTADGWLQLVILRDKEFHSLCDMLGLDELRDDPRFVGIEARLAHADFLIERVAAVLITRPSAEWRDMFTEAGLQNEVLQDYHQFVEHPHTEASGLISWLHQDGLERPWPVPNPPGIAPLETGTPLATSPRTGQHGREILAELGYDDGEIDGLLADGTVTLERR
ncbi:MAG: CoA transferase, partial [Alphaproteobacteria bacterium]|nr:CoA transferase [Alphaproteobacteria bacterium]